MTRITRTFSLRVEATLTEAEAEALHRDFLDHLDAFVGDDDYRQAIRDEAARARRAAAPA